MVWGRGDGTADDLTRSNVSSALPCQALTSDWWTGQMGKNVQCSGCPVLEYLMAWEAAARLQGWGTPGRRPAAA